MKTITFFASVMLMISQAAFAQSASPEGRWLLSTGKLTVKVVKCDGDKICGNIAALDTILNPDGTEKLDFRNPNPSLRSRRVIGSPVFMGMKPNGENRWKGTIYSADDGGTYRAYAALNGNAMVVQGCWGPFCKTLNFKRIK
jgi:uncharacterized protein (DUF2147 family)